MLLTIFSDGGARGNPGPAGIGVVVVRDGKTIAEWKEYIGETTNNVAEYRAIIKGLALAKQHGASEVACFLDSELVVKQLNREYRVKDKELQPLFLKVWNAAQQFSACTFTHVSREQNKRADALVNKAIDEKRG